VACDPLTYSGVDASKWACAKDVVSREYGIRIASDRGEASERGFKLKWTYDAAERTLQIQCSKKPFLVPCGIVNNRIRDAADKCGLTAAPLSHQSGL
jgi:hypothetical protein